ncbi:hypothetical protein V6N13_040677 [Hibiscus sabdariffa]
MLSVAMAATLMQAALKTLKLKSNSASLHPCAAESPPLDRVAIQRSKIASGSSLPPHSLHALLQPTKATPTRGSSISPVAPTRPAVAHLSKEWLRERHVDAFPPFDRRCSSNGHRPLRAKTTVRSVAPHISAHPLCPASLVSVLQQKKNRD